MMVMEKKACMAFLTRKLIALVLVLGLAVLENHQVGARFVVEKSSIAVLSPLSMRSKRDGSIGNFGIPDYGGFMLGSVVYPEKGSTGCQAFEGDKPFKAKFPRPTILLLDRGGMQIELSTLKFLSLTFDGLVKDFFKFACLLRF